MFKAMCTYRTYNYTASISFYPHFLFEGYQSLSEKYFMNWARSYFSWFSICE